MGIIYIVDDHPEQCGPLVLLMQYLGHDARCFGSSREALELLKDAVPDVLVLDVMMPGMDGIELLGHLRRSPQTSRLPVVIYSALSDPQYQRYVLSKGANDYWVKGSIDLTTMEQKLLRYLPTQPWQ